MAVANKHRSFPLGDGWNYEVHVSNGDSYGGEPGISMCAVKCDADGVTEFRHATEKEWREIAADVVGFLNEIHL